MSIPDYSTLCRYRNWLAQDNTLSELLELINRQLTEKGLKVEKASAAVVDATIIQTAGSKQRQAIEVDDEGQVSGQTTPSKDSDARWIKKNGLYKLGYKQHTRTDAEGYIEKLHITPANAPVVFVVEGLPKGTTTKRNRYLSKTRYVIEQSFGTLHRKFRYARSTYFGLTKSSEGDVFEPFENRQQARCACCCLKGGWVSD